MAIEIHSIHCPAYISAAMERQGIGPRGACDCKGFVVLEIAGTTYKCRRVKRRNPPFWLEVDAYDFVEGWGFCPLPIRRPETLKKMHDCMNELGL